MNGYTNKSVSDILDVVYNTLWSWMIDGLLEWMRRYVSECQKKLMFQKEAG